MVNGAIFSSLRGDADGDELNILCCKSQDSRAELDMMQIENAMGTSQSSTITFHPIQGSVIGMYLLTRRLEIISPAMFDDYAMNMWIDTDERGGFQRLLGRIQVVKVAWQRFIQQNPEHPRVQEILTHANGDYLHTGWGLVSLMLPATCNYTSASIRVVDGNIVSGCMTEAALAGGVTSLLRHVWLHHTTNEGLLIVDACQRLAGHITHVYDCSFGVSDWHLKNFDYYRVLMRTQKDFLGAIQLSLDNGSSNMDEVCQRRRVETALRESRRASEKDAKECIMQHPFQNQLACLILGGTRDKISNTIQTCIAIGQQHTQWKATGTSLCHNHQPEHKPVKHTERMSGMHMGPAAYKKRTMMDNKKGQSIQREARNMRLNGYIDRGCFSRGMRPECYFNHLLATREALVETSIKPAVSGFQMRSGVVSIGNSSLGYDHSVRGIAGKHGLVDWVYGQYGFDARYTVPVKGYGHMFTDPSLVASELRSRATIDRLMI
jgi:hypothetical protein